MDIKAVKTAVAGCLGTLLKIDPLTGLPYNDYSYEFEQTVRSNAQAPMSIDSGDFPEWIIFAAAATYPDASNRNEGRLSKENRDFVACLYVCIAQAGIDGEAERRVEPYIEPARALFASHPLFYDGKIADIVPGIQRAYLLRDDGIVQMRYGQETTVYNGLRFTFRVEALNIDTLGNE